MKTKVQLASGSVILTLVVVRAISYPGMVSSSESERWVRHTHEVLTPHFEERLRMAGDLQLLCTDVCVAPWAETVVNRNEILA